MMAPTNFALGADAHFQLALDGGTPVTVTVPNNQNNTNLVTFATANSYSGQTTVNGGGLRVSNPNALGTGPVYVPNIGDPVLSPTAHLEINALQRAATIVFQKSTREGFGLTVTEAMWKGKPVIGGATGGITVQVIPGETGYTVSSPEGAAFYAKRLLNEPDRLAVMGRQAKEYVRHRFLITRHLQEYLAVIIQLGRGAR